MNKKQLSIELSKLKQITDFNVKLEQYQLDGNFAADFLWISYQNNDIKNKIIADLGCGNGILGIGALLLGAKFVYFLDSDKTSLDICLKNIKYFDFKNYKITNNDVGKFDSKTDIVVMNPPFGVQKRKADKIFLETAMRNSNKIYSIHKIESKNFIEKLSKENNFSVLNIIEKNLTINKTYRFHKYKKYTFRVGFWILNRF